MAITNPNNIKATVTIKIGPAPTVKTFDGYGTLEAIIVDNGTVKGSIPFPATIEINTTVNGVAEDPKLTLPITGWTEVDTYDPDTEGDYAFAPIIDKSSVSDYTDNAGDPPNITVHVNAAVVTPVAAYESPSVAVPSDYMNSSVSMTMLDATTFSKLQAVAATAGDNAIEDAWMGIYDAETDTSDIDSRTVEFRYYGTAAYPISTGIKIPSEEDDSAAFETKLISLGVPDGTFGSAAAPVEIVSVYIDYSDDPGAQANSYIQFNQSVPNTIFKVRIHETGGAFSFTDDPNNY